MNSGFVASGKTVEKIWSVNAKKWKRVGSPWRPSPGDIRVYRQLVGSKLAGSTLVLGATPEIRDLVARRVRRGRLPILVDVNIHMLETMSQFLHRASPTREIWVKADWCSAPLANRSFDLIIADMVWWVISTEQQRQLAKNIARWLKSDGVFVSRFRVLDPKRKLESSARIIASYLERFRKEPHRARAIRDAMVSHLHDVTADRHTRRIQRARTRHALIAAAARTRDRRDREFILEATRWLTGADWTCQTLPEIIATIRPHLLMIQRRCSDDYDSTGYPIIKFEVKA